MIKKNFYRFLDVKNVKNPQAVVIYRITVVLDRTYKRSDMSVFGRF